MPSSVISHECARLRIVGAIALGAVARIALGNGIGAALHRAERRRRYRARGANRAIDNSRGCIKRRKAIVPVSVVTPIASLIPGNLGCNKWERDIPAPSRLLRQDLSRRELGWEWSPRQNSNTFKIVNVR